MYERPRLPRINISAIPVAGVGGLGLMAVVGLMAVAIMEVRIFMILAFIAGSILGAALIFARRETGGGTWNGPAAHVFFSHDVRMGWRSGRVPPAPGLRELKFALR